jgi:L-ascorbate metabolism protein UlaG (beta-lactamase superfamily)
MSGGDELTYQDIAIAERNSGTLDEDHAFLRTHVKVEPLVDRWPAWTHILAPPQQAMNLAFRYLPALQSFVSSPGVHIAAAQDPEMYGGPFVALPLDAVPAVQAYIAEVTEKRAEALRFAQQFREFDRRLLTAAQGYSLNEHRLDMPEALKGRIELVYDLNKHPKMKLLEEMFEEDDMGLRASEGVRIHDTPDVQRHFFLSTPYLDGADGLFVRAPLASEQVMQLCEARTRPVRLRELAAALGLPLDALKPYFTNDPGQKTGERYRGPGMRIRYFGHASMLVETAEIAILVDPTFAVEQGVEGRHLTFEDLPAEIDLVAISHGHQDHMSTEALMQLRHRIKKIIVPRNNPGDLADPSLKKVLRRLGFDNVVESAPLEALELNRARITMLPFSGEHCDLDVHAKQCFLIEAAGFKTGLFVDSDAIDIDVYGRLAHRLQGLDVLFVGMECNGAPLSWLYGPLTSSGVTKREDNSRRLSGANCGQASALVDLLKPRQAYVYAMGQESWMRSLMGLNYTPDSIQLIESARFVERCSEAGITSERLYGHKEIILE